MTGAKPLVSIVVCSYNYGRFLAAAIESALAQTYRPIEVLVIDDGSTDDSVEIASRLVPAVRLLTQANAGVVAACNRGASEAAGEWFCFLSADDTFAPTYVERMMEALERAPDAAFAYSDMRITGARAGTARAAPFSIPVLLATGANLGGSAVTRRADFVGLGGYASELQQVGCEDWDFWLRMAEHGRRGVYVPGALVNWTWHEAATRNVRDREERQRVAALIRARHPSLFGRKPRAWSWLLLRLAWASHVTRCRPCGALLEVVWGRPRPGC
jgi:glycosyltransferase involved in cell wall biosynthesis